MARSSGSRPSARGAVSNRSGRFERVSLVVTDDDEPAPDTSGANRRKTSVTPEQSRRILTTNDSPDIPFDRSINPYRGCEHGCVYCFARPTHAWLGLSPGLDFETRIFSKPDAPDLLRHELSRRGYTPQVVALGANTDPYQPVEKELGITRRIIEVLSAHEHPVTIVTKSALVLRDLDLLEPMAAKRLAHVHISLTTLDPELARRMEPRAATPSRRLETMRGLSSAGVPVGVLASPMIPGLNDEEIERILESAASHGATSAGTILLRLPLELKELFEEWLREHYPLRAKHVLALVRDTRGGELYQSEFGARMRGSGAYAELLQRRFELTRARLGLASRPAPLDVTRFHVPGNAAQLSLFGGAGDRRAQ